MTKNASFSFPDEVHPTYQRFKEIARREGKSASNILTDFIIQYVGYHDPGNPQQILENFMPEGQITISQIVGRIRQECLEYARKRNNEIRMAIITDLVSNSNIPRRERFEISKGLVSWLKNQGVKVWRR